MIQGVGGGMILPIGQLMMAEAAGPKRMGRVMSVVAVPAMLAPILGPTIGGLILDNVVLALDLLRQRPDRHDRRDRRRCGSCPRWRASRPRRWTTRAWPCWPPACRCITYGLAEIGVTGSFTAIKVVVPLLVGLALVAAFAVYALRVKRPLLNLRLYARPTFSSASVAMFCLGAALFGGMILLPLYWQTIRTRTSSTPVC